MNYSTDYRLRGVWYTSAAMGYGMTQSSSYFSTFCIVLARRYLTLCPPLFFSPQFKTIKVIPFGVKVFISTKVKSTEISWVYLVVGQSSKQSKMCLHYYSK